MTRPRSHPRLSFPVVVKPTTLSASRGVIRADDAASFVAAVARIRRLLASPEVRAAHEDNDGLLQVERYIDGAEYAVEGLMEHGALRVARHLRQTRSARGAVLRGDDLRHAVAGASAARARRSSTPSPAAPARSGCTMVPSMPNAASPPTASTCWRLPRGQSADCAPGALRFTSDTGQVIGLEELLLRHALGESAGAWTRETQASGGDDDPDSARRRVPRA